MNTMRTKEKKRKKTPQSTINTLKQKNNKEVSTEKKKKMFKVFFCLYIEENHKIKDRRRTYNITDPHCKL